MWEVFPAHGASRAIYRFTICTEITRFPTTPGLYAVIKPSLSRLKRPELLGLGKADHNLHLSLIEDPDLPKLLRQGGTHFAYLEVAGNFARQRIMTDILEAASVEQLAS